jgi:RNA polymerase sigma-70 factor (ECF subfamily)
MLPASTSFMKIDTVPIAEVTTGGEGVFSAVNTTRDEFFSVFFSTVANERSRWLSFVSQALWGLPSRLRRALDPEDVLQDAWLAAFKNQHSFQGQNALQFKRWFKMVILGTVRNLLRFHQRDKRVVNVFSLSLRETQNPDSEVQHNGEQRCVSPEPSPEQYLAMQEEIQRILEAIESLPPDQALLLLLVTVEELPLQEAAKELGISAQAASSRLWRARKRLEKALKTQVRHQS